MICCSRVSWRLLALIACLGALIVLGRAATAVAASPRASGAPQSSVVLVDGRDASYYTAEHPLTLVPNRCLNIYVRLTNTGHQGSLSVRSVRFQGRVLGLAFLSYETQVDLKAAAGNTDTRIY